MTGNRYGSALEGQKSKFSEASRLYFCRSRDAVDMRGGGDG